MLTDSDQSKCVCVLIYFLQSIQMSLCLIADDFAQFQSIVLLKLFSTAFQLNELHLNCETDRQEVVNHTFNVSFHIVCKILFNLKYPNLQTLL